MTTVAEPVAAVHTVAAPILTFNDVAKAIEFYKKALGARETMRFQIQEGIPHAEIMIGNSTIVLADEWPEGGRFSAETLGQSPISISLEVEDVDAFAERAVAEGLKMTKPPRDEFYGRRDSSIRRSLRLHMEGLSQSRRRCRLKRCIVDMRACSSKERQGNPRSTRFPRGIAL